MDKKAVVREIVCTKCGHKQKTRSSFIFVTCSSCQFKIKTREYPHK